MGFRQSVPERPLIPSIDPSKRGVIMALIIGNSEYNEISKLKNLNQP